jgi:D-Tyr-tRNAtyr deacylase
MQWKWFAIWDPHTKGFYATRNGRKENGESVSIQMHREILGLSLGDKRKSDHANRNTLDNRRLNLRIATNSQNGWNQKCHSNSKTGLKGISFHKTTGLYQAEIRFGGKRIYLGKRATAEQAHELYKQASEELHKEFSRVR